MLILPNCKLPDSGHFQEGRNTKNTTMHNGHNNKYYLSPMKIGLCPLCILRGLRAPLSTVYGNVQ